MTAYGNRFLYAPRLHAARDGEWHPECPARLSAIQDQLIASRIDDLIVHETAPFASEVALGRVHTQAHIDYIRA